MRQYHCFNFRLSYLQHILKVEGGNFLYRKGTIISSTFIIFITFIESLSTHVRNTSAVVTNAKKTATEATIRPAFDHWMCSLNRKSNLTKLSTVAQLATRISKIEKIIKNTSIFSILGNPVFLVESYTIACRAMIVIRQKMEKPACHFTKEISLRRVAFNLKKNATN